MTIKLLWLPGPGHYDLRVFAGPSGGERAYVGQLRLKPAEAATLRRLILDGDAAGGELVVSEVGWQELQAPPA